MSHLVNALWKDQSGQDLVEYVLIIVLIALGVAVALTAFKGAITNAFNNASTTLNTQATPS
jgi:Flp pilus assembly pilin Flp